MADSLSFRPTSWSVIEDAKSEPHYLIFGYTTRVVPDSTKNIAIRISVRLPIIRVHSFKYRGDTQELRRIFDPEVLIEDSAQGTISMVNPTLTEDTPSIDIGPSNPYGALIELFKLTAIQPYGWIKINEYQPLNQWTSSYVDITTFYSYIEPTHSDLKLDLRRMFWDLEVYSSTSEFPTADHNEDVIFMASESITGVSENVVNRMLHLKDISEDESMNSQLDEPMTLIQLPNEETLIATFLLEPLSMGLDRIYSYNGYGFDSNYLAGRVINQRYSIPSISNVLNASAEFDSVPYMGFFQLESGYEAHLPGVEQLDLMYYFRRFHPGLANYRLDTVANIFIGSGKTGLSIEELNHAYEVGDKIKLREGAEYGMVDSILLRKLSDQLNIDGRLDSLAAVSGLTVPEILRLPILEMANRIAYRVDYNHLFRSQRMMTKVNQGVKSVPGVYQNIYLYDYSSIYVEIVRSIGTPETYELSNIMEIGFPELRSTIFKLNIAARSMLDGKYLSMLKRFDNEMIIFRDQHLLMSQGTNSSKLLKLIMRYDYIYTFSDSSYVTITSDADGTNIQKYGRSELVKPKFPLASKVIDHYLLANVGLAIPDEDVSIGPETPLEYFIGTEKLTQYSAKATAKILLEQYGGDLQTWVNVEWVQTVDGPLLLSLYDTQAIDYDFYATYTRKLLQRISKLPKYM